MPIKTFRFDGKNIGQLNTEKNEFSKDVRRSVHLMRVLKSWGVDSATLRSLPDKCTIIIHEVEENIFYLTKKEEYLENGRYYEFKNEVVGHGKQIFLSLDNFFQVKNGVAIHVPDKKEITPLTRDEKPARLDLD